MQEKQKLKFKLNHWLKKCYEQQNTLASIDKSFIRVLPEEGKYSRESVKEAIYYASCINVEILEYSEAPKAEKLEEATDVAIFALNFLAYLGMKTTYPSDDEIELLAISDPAIVSAGLNKTIAELLYNHIDYKQWKFPTNQSSLSIDSERILLSIIQIALSLLTYEILTQDTENPKTIDDALQYKMNISIERALNEVQKNKAAATAN